MSEATVWTRAPLRPGRLKKGLSVSVPRPLPTNTPSRRFPALLELTDVLPFFGVSPIKVKVFPFESIGVRKLGEHRRDLFPIRA